MSPKEGLEAIKKLLFDVTPVPAPVDPAPVALATEYKLADGTVCSIDKLEVGGIVSMNGTPCPDGEYTLEDGTALTVAGGLISVVTPKAEVPAEAPADMSQFKAEFDAFKVEFAAHKEELTQVKSDFAAAKETISNQDLAFKKMLEVVETLSKVEVAQPAQAPVDFEKMTPLQKFRATK